MKTVLTGPRSGESAERIRDLLRSFDEAGRRHHPDAVGTDMAGDFDRIVRQAADYLRLRRAINKASYALNPNQGERPDMVAALTWLRTAYDEHDANYLTPERAEELAPGLPEPF